MDELTNLWSHVRTHLIPSLCTSFHFLLLAALFVIACCALLTNEVHAEEEATTTETSGLHTDFSSAQDIQAQSNSLSDRSQKRIINLSANISNRIEATINRLLQISNRLEKRIAIVSETTDTTAASNSLQQAQADLYTATEQLHDIDHVIVAVATSENALTSWQEAKERYQSTATTITVAKENLRQAVSYTQEPPIIESAATSSETQ